MKNLYVQPSCTVMTTIALLADVSLCVGFYTLESNVPCAVLGMVPQLQM